MGELQNRLDKLALRVDRMAMRVEQAVLDALDAMESADVAAGLAVDAVDALIDREEVEIEEECIRLLALYQPAAIDLRTICTLIKVNSDLERIADLAASIGRAVRHVPADEDGPTARPEYRRLKADTLDVLRKTSRLLSAADTDVARQVIDLDHHVDRDYRAMIESVLSRASLMAGAPPAAHASPPDDASPAGHASPLDDASPAGHTSPLDDASAPRGAEARSGAAPLRAAEGRAAVGEALFAVLGLAKALERIGDLCTNIAEDVIFLRTGDIIRHRTAAPGPTPPDSDGSGSPDDDTHAQ